MSPRQHSAPTASPSLIQSKRIKRRHQSRTSESQSATPISPNPPAQTTPPPDPITQIFMATIKTQIETITALTAINDTLRAAVNSLNQKVDSDQMWINHLETRKNQYKDKCSQQEETINKLRNELDNQTPRSYLSSPSLNNRYAQFYSPSQARSASHLHYPVVPLSGNGFPNDLTRTAKTPTPHHRHSVTSLVSALSPPTPQQQRLSPATTSLPPVTTTTLKRS